MRIESRGDALAEVDRDGGVVGGALLGAWGAIDGAGFESGGEVRREQEVVDADAAVVLEGLAEVVPEGELAGLVRVEMAEGVGVAESEEGAVGGAGLGLKEGVADPGGGLVAVDVFGDDVEVAADDCGSGGLEPAGHLLEQALHPGELVGELVGADGVAVGQVDVDDANAVDDGFEEAGMAILLVAGEGGGDGVDGMARENGDAVVGLLGDGGGLITDGLEDIGGEVSAFELLEEEDVWLVDLEPGDDERETGTDGVDVPGGDSDGEGSFPLKSTVLCSRAVCGGEADPYGMTTKRAEAANELPLPKRIVNARGG